MRRPETIVVRHSQTRRAMVIRVVRLRRRRGPVAFHALIRREMERMDARETAPPRAWPQPAASKAARLGAFA